MAEFLKKVWVVIQNAYFGARNFLGHCVVAGVVYGERLMDSVRSVEDGGEGASFKSWVKASGGFLFIVGLFTAVYLGAFLVTQLLLLFVLAPLFGPALGYLIVVVLHTVLMVDLLSHMQTILPSQAVSGVIVKGLDGRRYQTAAA